MTQRRRPGRCHRVRREAAGSLAGSLTHAALLISPVPFASAADLVAELDLISRRATAATVIRCTLRPSEFDGPGGQMLLATLAGESVGCVGLRRINAETAELKRMYVRPGFRGPGIARALLAACEQAGDGSRLCSSCGSRPGTLQPEAVALYLSAGYEPVAAVRAVRQREPVGSSRPSPSNSAASRCDTAAKGSH